MAATNGTLVIVGTDDKGRAKRFEYDVYIPDATGPNLTWNGTGLAASTSQAQLVIPSNGYITEFISVTTPTAVGFVFALDSAVVQGGCVRHANVVNSLATRVTLGIPVSQGQILTAVQF
jgi:hypothetical protein